MWTPKRIMLLVVGFVLFTLAYLLYSATTLGRINTLPPLPEILPDNESSNDPDRPSSSETDPAPLEKKMERAFGTACRELKWPVQLELNSKSMVMAAGMFEVVDDGRMRLEPMSIGLFGKKKNNGTMSKSTPSAANRPTSLSTGPSPRSVPPSSAAARLSRRSYSATS